MLVMLLSSPCVGHLNNIDDEKTDELCHETQVKRKDEITMESLDNLDKRPPGLWGRNPGNRPPDLWGCEIEDGKRNESDKEGDELSHETQVKRKVEITMRSLDNLDRRPSGL